MYAPESLGQRPRGGPGTGHIVEISTEQYEITLGVKYFYDSP